MTRDDEHGVEKVQALTSTTAKQEDDVEEGKIDSLDEAELFLTEHDISYARLQEMMNDETKAKKLRRRIDYILLPLLCGTYVLQYIDKQVRFRLTSSKTVADKSRPFHTVPCSTCLAMPTSAVTNMAGWLVYSILV